MPSLAVAPQAYVDTYERTLRSKPRTERPKGIDPTWLNVENSQVLTQNVAIETLQADIHDLLLLRDDWNGYGSPRPSPMAISAARSIVRQFRSLSIIPEKVSASADGGVALIFVGADKHRAVIEAFGTQDDYALFYDTDGNSRTLPWPLDDQAQKQLLSELQSYLRGSQVAPLG